MSNLRNENNNNNDSKSDIKQESNMDINPLSSVMMVDNEYLNQKSLFIKKGYKIENEISQTLQGKIYFGRTIKLNKNNKKLKVIIKTASIKLHSKGISYIEPNKSVKVFENIIKEVKVIKHLQKMKTPKGLFFNIYYIYIN